MSGISLGYPTIKTQPSCYRIVVALMSANIPAELAVNRALGTKAEIYLACTDSPEIGSTLHSVCKLTASGRKRPAEIARFDPVERPLWAKSQTLTRDVQVLSRD